MRDDFSARVEGDNGLKNSLDSFLRFICKNKVPDGFSWDEVRAIVLAKFTQIAKAFESEQPIASLPAVPNVDNYNFVEYCERISKCLERFDDAPFTLGRICELLLEPKKHYDRGDKFLRAFEKCVAVTSTSPIMETAEMNGVEVNKMQNGDHSVDTTENGVAKEENVSNGTNGHFEADAVVTKHTPAEKLEENAVSSSVESAPVTEQANEDQKVGSSTEEAKPVESTPAPTPISNEAEADGGAAKTTESENRAEAPKRQLEEEDTVAKKIARMENGTADETVKNGSAEEPTTESKPETNGNHEVAPAKGEEAKADTGAKEKDESVVVGEGTAV